ncbi:MAG: hypothetical protein HQK49_09125 [Oligoflexia bacterium]|nr:hypothetical protein [Oligoflexia bacterium]
MKKTNFYFRFVIIFLMLVLFFILTMDKTNWGADAGVVRDVYLDDNKTEKVTLKMGKTTVISFIEKPVNVVIGNKNYFNVAYVANDVTIQPLRNGVETNLFVYGKFHRYGFIIRTEDLSGYDDLLKVRWIDDKTDVLPKKQISTVQVTATNPVPAPVSVPVITLVIKNLRRTVDVNKGFVLIDFSLANKSGEKIDLRKINFNVHHDGIEVVPTTIGIVFEKDVLNDDGEESKGRILYKVNQGKTSDNIYFKEIVIDLKYQQFNQKLVIKEEVLPN